MRFKLKVVPRALFGVVSAGLTLSIAPAFAQQPAPQRLERIEVTGSNIKRVDTETVAPVEVITREEILRSGRPNIAEVLRNIPSNSGGSFAESNTNNFSAGSSGIALRGLSQKATLVLLNGRRVTGYGFAQGLQNSFVDLNAIPTSAVERIEILKDGASAIYGSDAVAGVVNIILRKDYTGIEGTIGGGHSEGKNEYSANLTGGFGDLGRDKFNVFATLDLFKRDEILLSDTKFAHTRDMRGQLGGRNFQSLTGGGTWRQLTGATTLTQNFKSITECRGTVLNGIQAADAGLINLSTNQPASTLAINRARAVATNTFCTQDFNNEFSALPSAERVGFLTRGTYQFTPSTQGYLEFGYSHNRTEQKFQDPFFAGTSGLQQTPLGLRPFPYDITFAPGVAGNPYPTNARYTGVFADLGTRDSKIDSNTARILGGLNYGVGAWDFDSAVGYSRNEVKQQNINRITLAGTSAAFNVPTTPQPPVPISTASSYNLDRYSTNSQAVRDSIRISFPRNSTSELGFVDTKASAQIEQIRLPGGALGVAIGGELRKEKLNDRPDPNAANGNILGQGITKTDGDRTNYAIYTEFALPIFKQLEAQVAGRFDHYSDYGSSKTPKLGLKYAPNEVIAFRGNWGKGFRAPTLPEISPSTATFFQTVTDPEDGVQRQISGVFAGNPSLKAETSVSSTAGIIFEPTRSFNIGFDVYKIRYRNVVASKSFQTIINSSCPAGGPGCPSTANVVRDPATNQVVTILSNYENLDERRTSGVDIDARYIFPTTPYGKFTFRTNATYIHTFSESTTECVSHNGCTNTIPRVRATFTLDWDYGPLAVTGKANYVHGFYQDLLAATFFSDANDPRFQNGAYRSRVSAYYTYDLSARYNVTKNLSVSAAAVNIFNKVPPYDPGFSGTTLYDFSVYDIRGRQLRANLTYKM